MSVTAVGDGAPLPPDVAAVSAAVERTLERAAAVVPAAASRARVALTALLSGVGRSAWPEIAGRFSRLTTTGVPVELAWTGRDAALRWTAEVAPPETPSEQRLTLAGRWAGVETRHLAAAQHGRVLRYGAWLGGRHGDDGHDAAKVYAELPEGAGMPAPTEHPVFRSWGLTWRMAGVTDDGTAEWYARAPRADEADLLAFERATLGSRGLLRARVRELLRSDALPRPCGLSVAFSPAAGGAAVAITWFAAASAMFADDGDAVRGLSATTDDDASRALLEALLGPGDSEPRPAADRRRRIVPIGVGVAVDGSSWAQAGLLPG